MRLLTVMGTLASLLASNSVASAFDLYPESLLNSQDNNRTAGLLTSADNNMLANFNDTSTIIVKGFLKKLVGIPSQKTLNKLKRRGAYFVLPMYVGTNMDMEPQHSQEEHLYTVQLDTSSSETFLFTMEDSMMNGVYDGYSPRASDTYQPVYSTSKKDKSNTRRRKPLTSFEVQRFGGILKGVLKGVVGSDTVQVGGIKMKDTKFGIIDVSSQPSLLELMDGSIGLGLGGEQSILKEIGRNSKTMKKSEVFSVYICSGGQAGQLQLGGVDKKLLISGRRNKVLKVDLVNEGGQYTRWAVNLQSSVEPLLRKKSTPVTTVRNQVAIIDSSYPSISAPLKVIQAMLENIGSLQVVTLPAEGGTVKMRRGKGRVDILPTIHEEDEVWMIKCSERSTMGTLVLRIGSLSVQFTTSDLVGEEMEDQEGEYIDMCKLGILTVNTYQADWRLGLPFFEKVGLIVFDKKANQIRFPPVKHSGKICGPIKKK